MKNEEIKSLIIDQLSDDQTDPRQREQLDLLLPDYSFKGDFRERVMNRLDKKKIIDFSFYNGRLTNTFFRIALTGIVAIILLVAGIYISQGSIDYDALLGIDSSLDEGLISLLID